MRVNFRKVYSAWVLGKAYKKSDSFWTDGSSIYSYRTIILQKSHDDVWFKPGLLLNITRYSVTTTCYQNSLIGFLHDNPHGCYHLTNIPINARDLNQYIG